MYIRSNNSEFLIFTFLHAHTYAKKTLKHTTDIVFFKRCIDIYA